MKKIILGFLSIIFVGQIAMAQPVSDHAVIPMAITVQSVLRLNVKSGGNIEFVFSTINSITNGIANTAAYNTTFDVAATQNWDVFIGTDNANFVSDEGATLTIAHVSLFVDGVGINAARTSTPFGAAGVLVQGPTPLLEWVGGAPNTNVGNAVLNAFTIHWASGVAPATTMVGTAPGRYAVNVYLSLVAAN